MLESEPIDNTIGTANQLYSLPVYFDCKYLITKTLFSFHLNFYEILMELMVDWRQNKSK